jgi:hypothetical protein
MGPPAENPSSAEFQPLPCLYSDSITDFLPEHALPDFIAIHPREGKLINRTFAVMMAASGMDAVILDVTDEELVNALITADLMMNRSIYADSYIEAFRS